SGPINAFAVSNVRVQIAPVLTRDTTPALTGTVSDLGALIQVTIDGHTYTATNNGDGTWTLSGNSLPRPLSEGTYTVTVQAADAPNTVGADKAPLVIDTTPPKVSVYPLVTGVGKPTLTGKVDDATAMVWVTVAGKTYPAVNTGTGTWTLPGSAITSALAPGA